MRKKHTIKNYRNRSSLISRHASAKMKAMIPCESTIERDYARLVEVDLSVKEYQSQPFAIEYWLNEKCHTYTPDFWVVQTDKKQVVEVKPKARVAKHKELFQAIALKGIDEGWEFVVVTEEDIRVEPRLTNAKILCRYSHNEIPFDALEICRAYLKHRGSTTLGGLKKHLAATGHPVQWVYTLMYQGTVNYDINQPFDDDLKLWI